MKKHEKIITPVMVMSPKNLKSAFLQALVSIEKTEG
jgi:hypothetical protein